MTFLVQIPPENLRIGVLLHSPIIKMGIPFKNLYLQYLRNIFFLFCAAGL